MGSECQLCEHDVAEVAIIFSWSTSWNFLILPTSLLLSSTSRFLPIDIWDSQREPERKGLRSGTYLEEILVLGLMVEAGDVHPSFQGNQVCTYC